MNNANSKGFNWQIWAGFLLTFLSGLSYLLIFINWPITRDFPWVSLVGFAVAAVLLFIGIRRGFAGGRRLISKITTAVLATISVLMMGLFLFSTLIMSRWVPASSSAPQAGQRAPDFSLADTSGRQVALTELLSTPIPSAGAAVKPKGVLLVFYRGYW